MSRARDRRQGRRIEVRFPARISMRGNQPIFNMPAPVIDVSNTGLCIKTSIPLATHKMATIEAVCDGKRYRTRGRVVRVDPAPEGGYHVGIELDPDVMEENPFPTSVLVVHGEMPDLYPPRPS